MSSEKPKIYALGKNNIDPRSIEKSDFVCFQAEDIGKGKPLSMNTFIQGMLTSLDDQNNSFFSVYRILNEKGDEIYKYSNQDKYGPVLQLKYHFDNEVLNGEGTYLIPAFAAISKSSSEEADKVTDILTDRVCPNPTFLLVGINVTKKDNLREIK